jgi:hypothetical protein
MEFSIQHAKDKPFTHDGLREYFDYREISHSDDFEVLEIVLPGTFKTVAL